MTSIKNPFIFGLLFFCISCAKREQNSGPKDVVDLMPLDNEISGWVRSGAMDIAENSNQLWQLINGEGQVYIDNDFAKCAFQTYTGQIAGSQVNLDLRVFDMRNPTNAKNVYDDVGIGSEIPWADNGAGDEARIDESALYAYRVDFRDDRFYVCITIHDKSDAALEVAKLFALNVSAAIGGQSTLKRTVL